MLRLETLLIQRAMRQNKGNVSQAVAALQIPRTTLQYRLKKLGIL